MSAKRITLLAVLVMAVALFIAACGQPATTAPDPEPEPDAPATTAPDPVDPDDEEVMDEFEPMVVSAGSCDYGGKILEIAAVDELTVRFTLCSPDPAFLAKVAFVPFGIQPSEWIAETGGTGEILERPIGTGPYQIVDWQRGDSITFERFDDYWGTPAIAQTLILRWASEGAARLLQLQAGTADYVTLLSPDDFDVVQADANLQLLLDPNPNIFYVGFTNTFAPFDDVRVRQAIALGLDRQRIVDNFFPEGSQVAGYFTPCSIPNGCAGEEWYDFDPVAARQLLADAGYPDGFETAIYYRDVFRVYLPEPNLVAVELQTQLRENLGIEAEVVLMESGEFIQTSTQGQLSGIHLLGWGADYPHVTNFLDFHFGEGNPQFGNAFPEIFEPLVVGGTIADADEANPYYVTANNAIREFIPLVPIAHGAAADAAAAYLSNAQVRPFGAPAFALMDPGKDTLVVVQNAEPISLFCADESDGESLSACEQVVETLYKYQLDSGDVDPALATECVPNDDLTVWTCALRAGVKFHDGSAFDANDVVASWAAGIDAANPYHVGNSGAFDYYAYLWGALMNDN